MSALLALLAIIALAAWIPSAADAEEVCYLRQAPGVAGYDFPETRVRVDDRRYTVTGESKLTDYRSNLSREQALALDRRIATFLGVDPSETEDSVRLTLDLSREMSIERLLESLLTFLRRVNGGMLGGVATYTICADDGRPADEAQIEQAL